MVCESVTLPLQDLSTSIQELASNPSAFVLHRSHCLCLAASYSAATSHVLQQLQHLSTCLDPQTHLELKPSLLELLHVMLQGHKFMRDCLHQKGWVRKAVLMAFSTEAQDVHLHDLVWCLCVIRQAMSQLALQTVEPETNLYTLFDMIWAKTSHRNDLRVLMEALGSEITYLSAQRCFRKGAKAQQSLAKFLLNKLSWESESANVRAAFNDLPRCLWVNPNEISIKESIGHGAYAVVHEVEWNGQTYGQKEFFEVDEDVFAREASIQSRLRHPNLLQLICCTSKPSKNKCSLVMELMDTNLRSMIDKRQGSGMNPPFTLLTSVDLMLQIAKGMEHLHGLCIMHRDLKSFNILVTNQVTMGESLSDCRMHLRIADFGMSKAKNQSSKYTSLHVGTSYWRAPEVFHINPENEFLGQPTAKYTKEADVYSFSMVCFEILSGDIPFDDGGKLGDLHGRLLNGERPKLPESCPPYLASYIERCWEGDSKERPTFAQISRTLRHLKGVLLASADPLTPLALSVRSLSRIDDNLTQMMGTNWPSTVSGSVATRTLTISFEMSWYKVMECKLTKENEIEAAEGFEMKRMPLSIFSGVATSKSNGPNRLHSIVGHDRKKRCFFRAVDCIMVDWNSKLSGNETQMAGVSDSKRGRMKCPPLNLWRPATVVCWNCVTFLPQLCCCLCMRRAKALSSLTTEKEEEKFDPDQLEPYSLQHKLRQLIPQQEFSYSELAEATNHFEEGSFLGEGASGHVFKGVLRSGQAVAVKVMATWSSSVNRAFEAEADFLFCRVSHPNILPFLGYGFDETNRPMLVYKLMPRGSLKQYISEECGTILTWVQRRKIAIGVASALSHLHHECTPQYIHRDVKPSNILIDDDFNAYLSDFGTAITTADIKYENYSVMGTRPYVDPDYYMTLQLGPETDIFGFGVVLLQLVCGIEMVQSGTPSGLGHLKMLYEQGKLLDAVDCRVRADGDGRYDAEIIRLLYLGLDCCASRSRDRPRMEIVVKVLLGEIDAP